MQNQMREQIQSDALNELLKHNRRSAAISMRVGKTLIGIKVAAAKYQESIEESKNCKILVVVPKLSILDGWKEDIDKFNYQYLNEHIEYKTYVSFNKLDLSKYCLIIFDEVHSLKFSHLAGTKMDDRGLKLKGYEGDILGLTGTPPVDSYSEKSKMINRFCPIVYKYETEDAISDAILNDYRIIVHMIPLSEVKDIRVKTGKFDFMTSEKDNYHYLTKKIDDTITQPNKQWASISRMKTMQSYSSKDKYAKNLLQEIEDKCIIFCNTKTQAKEMCEHSYYSGNDDSKANLQLFKVGVIDKLSCILQLSEGQTIPELKACIIMHSFGNEYKFLQRFARCLSLSTAEMSNIHLLCYKDTVDEVWIQKALSKLDSTKIKYIEE